MIWWCVLIAGGTALAGLGLLDRIRIDVAPIGVYNLSDVTILAAGVLVSPITFGVLPSPISAALFTMVLVNGCYTITSTIRRRTVRLAVAITAVATLVAVAAACGPLAELTVWINNLLLAALVLSVALTWVHSGMRARHTAIICTGLAAYDILATSVVGIMQPLANRLTTSMPAAAFRFPDNGSLGMGDVLVATAAALTFQRTYGQRYALLSIAATVAALHATQVFNTATGIFPVLATLGPATIALHIFARHQARRRGASGQKTRPQSATDHMPNAIWVRGPAMPSTSNPTRRWKSRTAASVASP